MLCITDISPDGHTVVVWIAHFMDVMYYGYLTLRPHHNGTIAHFTVVMYDGYYPPDGHTVVVRILGVEDELRHAAFLSEPAAATPETTGENRLLRLLYIDGDGLGYGLGFGFQTR